jgi:hypothetical protein
LDLLPCQMDVASGVYLEQFGAVDVSHFYKRSRDQ